MNKTKKKSEVAKLPTVDKTILLISMNTIVKNMNDGMVI